MATKRERNEELCASTRVTYELNTKEFEFDPPFMVHIRCRNQADYENGISTVLEDQVGVISIFCSSQFFIGSKIFENSEKRVSQLSASKFGLGGK